MKKTKRSEKETDIRPLIYQMELREQGMYLKLAAGSEANLKPDLVMDAFYEKSGHDKKEKAPFSQTGIVCKESGQSGKPFLYAGISWDRHCIS